MKKFAVISHPRTGSRSLAAKIGNCKKQPIASLHYSSRLKLSSLPLSHLQNSNYVIHCHWHSLQYLNKGYLDHIRNFYQIFQINRNKYHSMLSTLIVMQTKKIDFTVNDIPKNLSLDLVYEYVYHIHKGNLLKKTFKNYITLDFDKMYNNASVYNFEKNKSKVKNFEIIQHTFDNLT